MCRLLHLCCVNDFIFAKHLLFRCIRPHAHKLRFAFVQPTLQGLGVENLLRPQLIPTVLAWPRQAPSSCSLSHLQGSRQRSSSTWAQMRPWRTCRLALQANTMGSQPQSSRRCVARPASMHVFAESWQSWAITPFLAHAAHLRWQSTEGCQRDIEAADRAGSGAFPCAWDRLSQAAQTQG